MDAETGRFISEDPAQDGNNWYVYGVNNPLINTDPTGMMHQNDNGDWEYDDWDYDWNDDYDCYNFWVYNDDFFSYGSHGGWWNDTAKLNAAWDFLGVVDFGSGNWVKAGGYDIPYYESRRVQTIQGEMGIDVTGWYDDQTSIATGTLQGMYGVNNARDSVFGLNTWRAMDSISNSPDRFWKYHEFYQEYKGNLAEAKLMDLVGDLIVNAAIFGGGKALLSRLLPEASIAFTPLEAGPLSQDVALTFRSATYTERTLNKATTFYRVIGKDGNPTGSFWTTTKPNGSVQSMLDSAILPEWGNPATNVVKITVPAGTRVYQGIAAPQGGLLGGGIQVYIPQVSPQWIQSIGPIGGM